MQNVTVEQWLDIDRNVISYWYKRSGNHNIYKFTGSLRQFLDKQGTYQLQFQYRGGFGTVLCNDAINAIIVIEDNTYGRVGFGWPSQVVGKQM